MRYAIFVLVVACSSGPKKTVAELQDPTTCMECHNQHYTEWSGSMHAYASDDPVFIAMNKRGQRDTNNQLGTFCIQCHAPMAIALGLVDDTNAKDFDPTALPPTARGITCYFCHNVKDVQADHNNGLVLALDDNMRGGVTDPTDSPAHNSSYDKKMDSYTNNSVMCGSCHDVVTPRGVALERSYQEWQTSVFATVDPTQFLPLTCSGCHMGSEQDTEVIADKPGLDVKRRKGSFHLHRNAAIDQAVTPFPDLMGQQAAITDILDPALKIIGITPLTGNIASGGICFTPQGELTVRMDTINTGHYYPSGAAQDRRVWLRVIAKDAAGAVLFSSGDVPPNKDPEDIGDPDLDQTGFWDRTFQDNGMPAHFFWDVATVDSTHLLKPQFTFDKFAMNYDHSSTAKFNLQSIYPQIDRVEATIMTRPFAYSVLDQLIASGDLDPAIKTKLQQLYGAEGALKGKGATRVWTKATAGMGIGSMGTLCNPNPPLPGM